MSSLPAPSLPKPDVAVAYLTRRSAERGQHWVLTHYVFTREGAPKMVRIRRAWLRWVLEVWL